MSKKMELLLAELEHSVPFYNKKKESISQSDAGWHIEHSLLTIDQIIARLSQSKNNRYKRAFSFPRFIVMTTGIIPRGRAQSPRSVQPAGDINPETLQRHLAITSEKLIELVLLDKEQFFEHPYFGHLKLKQAVRFLEIHTRHHVKIIRDIIC